MKFVLFKRALKIINENVLQLSFFYIIEDVLGYVCITSLLTSQRPQLMRKRTNPTCRTAHGSLKY